MRHSGFVKLTTAAFYGWIALTACGETASDRGPSASSGSGGRGGQPFAVAGSSAGGTAGGTAGNGGNATSGSAGSGGALITSLCEGVEIPAMIDPPLLDDFEDEDGFITLAGDQREGGWFLVDDAGAAGERTPASFAPSAGGPPGSGFAAPLVASGFTLWGAQMGVALAHVEDGERCPYNASGAIGVAFDAKGPGTVQVTASVPGIIPTEFGGTCNEAAVQCWDAHATTVTLSEDWEHYEVPWADLQQAGWGVAVPFDEATLVGLNWNFGPDALPIDFVLDNVTWIVESGAGGSGGSGGSAGGAAGSGPGGTAGEGGASAAGNGGAGGS
jgi:hypothetical protein